MGDKSTLTKLAVLTAVAVTAPQFLPAAGGEAAATTATVAAEQKATEAATLAAMETAKNTTTAAATQAGKSSLLTAKNVFSGLTAAGSLMSAYSGMQAGKAQEQVAKAQIEQEKLRARDEAIARREKLIDAISMQSARTGAAGITSVGTPSQVIGTDIKKFEYEDLAARASSRTQQNVLGARGQAAKSSGRLGAGISLLSGAADISRIG